MKSSFVVAVFGERVHVSAEATLEDVFGFNLHSFGAFANLMTDLGAIVADVVLGIIFGELLKQFLGALEVLLDEYLGVIVCAFSSLLAVAVHVIPAQLTNNVFKLAHLPLETETHVEVWTTLVNVPIRAVLSLLALLLHELWADLEVMAEVTLVPVAALSHTLKLIAGLDLALIVRVWAVIGKAALAVDELLANSIGGELVVIGGSWRLLLHVRRPFIEIIVVASQRGLSWIRVHIFIFQGKLRSNLRIDQTQHIDIHHLSTHQRVIKLVLTNLSKRINYDRFQYLIRSIIDKHGKGMVDSVVIVWIRVIGIS